MLQTARPRAVARGLGTAVLTLAACRSYQSTARDPLPRRLVRLGSPAPLAGACAPRVRDPKTGREYQFRSPAGGVGPQGGGRDGFGGAFGAVGLYVPVSSNGGLTAPPLRVECASLRVVGVNAP